jgi:hypothetical protein
MGNIAAGTAVPLNVQLPSEDGTQFCRATILDAANNPVAGSPVSLPYIQKGNYGSSSFLMPNLPWVKAIYEVFTDSGFTTLSSVYGVSEETFYLDSDGGGGSSGPAQSPRFVGKLVSLEQEEFTPCQKLFEIVQGSDVQFNVRLLNDDNGVPVDLSDASSISAKFLNTDGTFTTINLSSGIEILTPAILGTIQCSLTSIQTAALQFGKVSFEITIVLSGSTYVVQFPYMLNVLESVFS